MEFFVVLAYLLSWVIEIPLALQYRGVLDSSLPYALHYLAGYGPLAAAFMVTKYCEGEKGIGDLISRLQRVQVHPLLWLTALSPLLIYITAAAGLALFRGSSIDLAVLGQVDFLSPLGLAVIPFWILTFGIGEETGWRGFALPRLQVHYSPLGASFRLWVIWAFWHLPLFFYSYSIEVIPGMLIGLLAGTVVFTWLFNSSGGSVLITAVFHGLFNATTACAVCQTGWSAALISSLVITGAVIVTAVSKHKVLSPKCKQVISPGVQDFD
jgi:membrane protease YdiL (CAAX protease family)